MELTVLQENQVKRESQGIQEDQDFQDWMETKETRGPEGTKVTPGKRERRDVMQWVYRDHQDPPDLQGKSSTSKNF